MSSKKSLTQMEDPLKQQNISELKKKLSVLQYSPPTQLTSEDQDPLGLS